jgi:hypothetical protein
MKKSLAALLLFIITFGITSENLLFSAEISSGGATLLPQQQTYQTNQSLVDSKNELMTVAAVTSTQTTATSALLSYMRTNSAQRGNMNLLYGTGIDATGALTAYEQSTLSAITAKSGYSQSAYLTSLQKTAGLYRTLQGNTTQRQAFNKKYTSYLQPKGSPMATDRIKLFNATAPSTYTQSGFLSSLTGGTVTPPLVTTTTPVSTSFSAFFNTTSFWNTKGHTTVKAISAGMVAELVRQTKMATPWMNTTMYSTPFYVVNSSTPKVPVAIVKNGSTMTWTKLHVDSMKGVPIPAGAMAAGGTDGHITVWDTSTNKLYEYWQLKKNSAGKWQASWGGIIENASNSNGVMPIVKNAAGGAEYWGATGSGLAAIGGTILVKELKAGRIPHALAMAIPYAARGYVSPANRGDGGATGTYAIPEGSRFKLPASTYIDPAWPPMLKMIVTAARDYGIIVRDQAGAVTLFGEDPKQYGSNPFTSYYGGMQLGTMMGKFPWSKLQVTT